jgi:RNA polymerase sigma-70 factor, ECF subfamily
MSPPPAPDFLPGLTASHDRSSDHRLIGRLKARDAAALDEALDRYWDPVVAYATRLVERREDAKDITQDAFLQLWDGADRWEGDSEVKPLLFGIVRNLALKEKRRRAIRGRHAAQAGRALSRPASDPSTDAAVREFEAAIADAVSDLPERRREVFVLSRREGLSHREIAEQLGLSPQTVANHLSSALSELREALQPHLRQSPPRPTLRVIHGDRSDP